jgi:hypothetical protein
MKGVCVVPQTYYGCACVFLKDARLVGKRLRHKLGQGADHLGDADDPSPRASNKRCTTRTPAPPVAPAGCSRGVAVGELGMENQGSTERACYGPQVGVRCERVLGRVLTLACTAPLLPRCGCSHPHRGLYIFLFSPSPGAWPHERDWVAAGLGPGAVATAPPTWVCSGREGLRRGCRRAGAVLTWLWCAD